MRRSFATVSVSARALAMALVLPAALCVSTSTAQAQFGKLKKIGGEIAREAGRETVGLPPQQAGTPSKSSEDYSISAERLDVVMTALAPLAEAARNEAAAREVETAFEAKRSKWENCVEAAGKSATTLSPAYIENAGPLAEKSAAVMQRVATALQTGRKRQAAFLQDTAAVMGVELSALMTGAKCGPSVYTPAALIDATIARESGSGDVDESGRHASEFVVPERARKGLSTRQFGMLRERIAMYAIALVAGNGSEGSLKHFSDAERGALNARAADLKAIAPFFRDGSIRWSTWGDVKSW